MGFAYIFLSLQWGFGILDISGSQHIQFLTRNPIFRSKIEAELAPPRAGRQDTPPPGGVWDQKMQCTVPQGQKNTVLQGQNKSREKHSFKNKVGMPGFLARF